jgi:aldehyde dehydrogenase (NAD+)
VITKDRLFIGGTLVEPSSSEVIEVTNPSTEETIGSVPDATTADIDRAVAAAREAFDRGPWPRMEPSERAEVMGKLSSSSRAVTKSSPRPSPTRTAHRSRGR